jgi:antirestriction protein
MNPECEPSIASGPEQPATPEARRPDRPRIYVASLSDYNNGRLHGAWIDADQDFEAIGEEIGEMLAESKYDPAEEYAIHDYEGFGAYRVDEYENLEDVARIGRGIAEHGPAFAAFAAHLDPAEWYKLDDFDEHYRGQWASRADYAEQLLDDLGIDLENLGPEMLQPYISVDLDAFARDLAYDLIVAEADDGVYVFDRE